MQNEWIIDVLGDLRAFAADNDLPGLASQIEEALMVASVEIAQDIVASPKAVGHERAVGTVHRAAL